MPVGFPYPGVDPMRFLVDDEIRPFNIDIRHDLTGTGAQACPIISTGVFIVHEHVVPENTAEVVMNVFPHCWERTNVGATNSSVAVISPELLAGFVLFDNTKDNNQPYLVEHDYNAATLAAAPNDTDRQKIRGTTWLSVNEPLMRDAGEVNPLAGIYLPAKSLFRVLFRLAPASVANPVLNPYIIDAGAAAGKKRIDFAGAMVSGVRMPQQTYDKLKIARRNGQLGPEASSTTAPLGTPGKAGGMAGRA